MRSKAREKLMTFLLKLSFSYVSTILTSSLFSETDAWIKTTKTNIKNYY